MLSWVSCLLASVIFSPSHGFLMNGPPHNLIVSRLIGESHYQQLQPSREPQQQQQRHFTSSPSITPALSRITTSSSSSLYATAKSGGKLIESEEQYMKLVLAKDIPKPVLVFFSAPWYVL